MGNLDTLQEKVQAMLDGERKRRVIALQFVEKVTEILAPVADQLWSGKSTGQPESTDAVRVAGHEIYFRWSTHSGTYDDEKTGFYFFTDDFPVWGTPIENVTGTRFWYAIRCIIEWLPKVIQKLDEKEASREKLLSLLK